MRRVLDPNRQQVTAGQDSPPVMTLYKAQDSPLSFFHPDWAINAAEAAD